MSEVSRICPQCGGSVALSARFCGGCGFDTSVGLPIQRTSLPVQVGKAALPIVAGLAGLALRSGWKFLQGQLTQAAASSLQGPRAAVQPPVVQNKPTAGPRRKIRIQSSWVVGDGQGRWRQGQEEHIIEIDDYGIVVTKKRTNPVGFVRFFVTQFCPIYICIICVHLLSRCTAWSCCQRNI